MAAYTLVAPSLSACKQSGNAWMPQFSAVRSVAEAVAALPEEGGRCFGALQEGAMPLRDYLRAQREASAEAIVVFVGSEGDFSAREAAQLREGGVQPVSFGDLVLRVETAAVFALSAVQYEWL